jgi:GNAT superfamily N-acetyltransferase
MPLPNVYQPEIIYISQNVRLRKYDGNYHIGLPWYQDPYVYNNSEGIFDDLKKPDLDYIKGMYTWLNDNGELYFIEVLESDTYLPIGDITIKPENPPIAIGVKKYRGLGIGKLVMKVVIERLRTLGYKKIFKSTVYKWNVPSQKMHENLGFIRVNETENEFFYELNLNT